MLIEQFIATVEETRLTGQPGHTSPVKSSSKGKPSFLEAALRNEELTDDEQHAVLAFIACLKGVRKK
ncbi:MAG: hypothetical protein V2A56_13825 [bacterium]